MYNYDYLNQRYTPAGTILKDTYGSTVATADRYGVFRNNGGFDTGVRIGADRVYDNLGSQVGRVDLRGNIVDNWGCSTGLKAW